VLALLGTTAAVSGATPAFAQVPDAPAAPAEQEAAAPQGARSYTPEDFARFAPRTALDMLTNVPGFSISEGDTGRRGLGLATGNVLINGERFVQRSTDIFSELRRISAANVIRIEIVDGASLNVPGLSGQVANILTRSGGLSGNFAWRPQVRARRTPPRLLDGEVSINGRLGGTEYSLSFANESRRSGHAGPELVFAPGGNILDRREEVLFADEDGPRIAGTLRRTFRDGSILNANAGFQLFYFDLSEDSLRSGPGQPDRDRRLVESEREHNYELGGDYEFGLGGGRLKLIGVHRFEHSPYRQTLTTDFSTARPREGQRFTQTADESETILRGEYRWRGGRNDWQFSLEGALNRLDVENDLFDLAGGVYVPVPGASAAEIVEERRAEATLTYGRALSAKLNLQAAIGAEYSELSQTGAADITRRFFRPKGFLNVAWRPETNLDVSARVERVVGQLDFYDFVASSNVSSGTSNAGNADLVPPQRWNAQIEARRNLGRWGTITARLHGSLITDIVDIIPIGATGQSPGNIDGTATLYGFQWISTFNLDPLGLRGAKLDLNLRFQRHRLDDPLTGVRRAFNEEMVRNIDVNFRHDIPGSDWAWGVDLSQYRESVEFRLDQRFRSLNAPGNFGAFVEHKNVLGLTVRAGVDNLLDINEGFTRTFFDGRRNATNSNILFIEDRDRTYGPVFTLTISGAI